MSKQLPKKFLWMKTCMADSFGIDQTAVADGILLVEANRKKVQIFLDTQGPAKILVYYQTPDTGSENDHNADPQIIVTYGDTERIKQKAVWFMRNLPENKKKIDSSAGNNEQVIYGQITPNPVKVLNMMIEKIYDPLINSQNNQDWGQVEEQARNQFKGQIQRFKKEVDEAMKLMEPGKQHFEIKPEEFERLDKMSESERIQKFQQKFDMWIKSIQNFLNTEVKPKNQIGGGDPGPKSQLEFWKQRIQTITNWSEKLKSKDFNMVKASLIKYKQNQGKKQGQENINKLMLSFQRLQLALTDRLNEAKDNVKYLSTLQKFIEPLYKGTPQQIIETLPALMNAIKMIHTIARFYNTSDKMTGLFIKITNQMIKNCKQRIAPGGQKKIQEVWKRDPAEMIQILGNCIKLNRQYKQAYKITKQKMADMPKGKTFDFSQTQIFSKFDQFVKRLQKLIEVFSNIQQFDALAKLNLEKMDVIINKFNTIRDNFKQKRKTDLLDLTNSNFDKEYVSFNISISQLDTELQEFIDDNFKRSKSIQHSINLLKKFESTIKRDALKHNLTSKYNTILNNYASQLQAIQRVFNDQKSDPPIVRNMPQNAGKIIWSKHLYQKIAGPITKFPQNVIHSSEIKKYYGNYNTLGKMLTINEMWYYDLWVKQIERSKAALQATLIMRHQTQKKLYVNFDLDIMQLIREAKCLDRQGIPIPQNARIILLQEQKFKMYYNELLYVLKQYERIVGKIKPICKNILAPHIADMELKLYPGMSTLTWTSMNIDSYLNHIHQGLNKLEQLIINVNDIIENRVQNNLKSISKVSLVSLPHDNVTFTLETFVSKQEEYINEKRNFLTSKNLQIERAIDDLLLTILNYNLDPRIEAVKSEETKKIKRYYFWYLYNALLHATQNSLNSMKYRVCGSTRAGSTAKLNPFFEVDVQLSGTQVRLNPSLQQIQKAINKAATAVLRCSKTLYNWDHQNQGDKKQSLYEMIAQDKQIVKVILLLTGSIQGTKNKINDFLSKFNKFEWLWKKSISKSIKQFSKNSGKPQLSDYQRQLKQFSRTDDEIDKIQPSFIIGAMQLKTQSLILGLKQYTKQWKGQYAEDLHIKAKTQLYKLNDHIFQLSEKLNKTVVKDIDSLGIVMEKLQDVRAFQAVIDISNQPIQDMYALLQNYLPGGTSNDKDQQDARTYLLINWNNLVTKSQEIGKSLSIKQTEFLKKLKTSIKQLDKDVTAFRTDYQNNGPMVKGISPKEAIQRLKRFDEQYQVRQQQYKINKKGQQLFGLQPLKYPALVKTKSELQNLKKLYDLYSDVIKEITLFQETIWSEVTTQKLTYMQQAAKKYSDKCTTLPSDLKTWEAYKQLKQSIQNLKQLLPIIMILKKQSIKPRHWDALNEKTQYKIPYDQLDVFVVEDLIKAKVLDLIEDIQEIGQSAEKQRKIENTLGQIDQWWAQREFQFVSWGKRQNAALGGLRVQQITQRLQEDQMSLSSINAQRHVVPFKKRVEQLIRVFSDTGEILDQWIKVQKLWTSLQPVFTGGDIAKQMPIQAKQFAGIDKTWMKCMQKSYETKRVLPCCQVDLLKDNLPDMMKRLQECQKMLQAYLEGKRKLFPRFYFVSNPALLKILSQGSDPATIQQDFEKLFDAITKVEFGKSDKKGSNQKTITAIMQESGGVERVSLTTPVKCQGLIQSWLKSLEKEMQQTMRQHCRIASINVMQQKLQDFVKGSLSQVALMGIQIIWTHKLTQALEKGQKQNKGALQNKKKQIQKMLQQLTGMCLQPIETSLLRTKIQTLVTVHVHQRDIAQQIKCQSVNEFDWQKQTRLYWRQQEDTCIISITDWDQSYCYEFLGAKQRLCITPLTDRCYITLAQAMSMFYGGAPAGPAGTGKTQTVKDLGRGLGIFVVVTNCSDQHRYRDMAKIFKGLVQSGLWGCFDQFNRILLQVLSVVAMQVQCIGLAKKQHVSSFMFPQQQYPINIVHSVGYFITMNPGYAGRQQLPQNLKVLFRGVTMMVPDRQIIIKVKLASVGYQFINGLSRKFNILYRLCEQQLSKQRHYDFGLRNILSVLRTAGNTKRKQNKTDKQLGTPAQKQKFQQFLLMRSLRDMNMSKLVFDDIQLFVGLLTDIFPNQKPRQGKVDHKEVQSKIPGVIKKKPELINTASFTLKIVQVYETSQVRHGFMLLGLSATGKTQILNILTQVLSDIQDRLQYRIIKMNPKAITDKEMYGVKSQISDDWIPGVFSTLWQKCNDRKSKFNIWLTCDGPVDTIWIESLNTVLDDNKILTLANGERIPMTDQCKLVFEVQNLNNASPATVSRCGQIYISPTDLGHKAIYEGWCQLRVLQRTADEANIIRKYMNKFFDEWKIIQTLEKTIKNNPVMQLTIPLKVINSLNLIGGMLRVLPQGTKLSEQDYEKVITYAISWAVGGLYEAQERFQFHEYLQSKNCQLPPKKEGQSIFDYYVHIQDGKAEWRLIVPQKWAPSQQKGVKFSQLLLPTVDSWRTEFLINAILQQIKPIHSSTAFQQNSVLLVGGSGTAKTSSVLMWGNTFDTTVRLFKRVNFSSATSPGLFQASIQQQCDNKMGKDYGPPQNKKLAVFIDDMSMPFINTWGDQVTLQIVRQLIQQGGFYWLDKAQRGNFKNIKNLSFVGAMNHPGGGRNDIPNRLKRQFFIFNMILPLSIEAIYGPIVKFQLKVDSRKSGLSDEVKKVIQNLTSATIKLWQFVKKYMLPTPAKFHYLFNMRQLARTFKGILQVKNDTIMTCKNVQGFKPELFLVGLWRHECQRVFCDKLVNNKDKYTVLDAIHKISIESFGMEAQINDKFSRDKQFLFADFLQPDVYEQGVLVKRAPMNYEACIDIQFLKRRGEEQMNNYNQYSKSPKKLKLVLFNDALKHLLKLTRILKQPRSSALLVGVGGSGKQSVTRLAAFIEKMQFKQIELVKNYGQKDLKEDIKKYFEITGRFGKHCCFILTDAQIKKEEFLEYISMILSTGQVPGLLAKDQKQTFLGDARNDYAKQFKGADPTASELYSYFVDRVRDNLHVCLCFSPVGQKFRDRFRKFPALFNQCTIDWFLPWPQQALVSVANSFLSSFKQLDTTAQIKAQLMKHMGNVHLMVTEICDLYFNRMRRQVFFTPKSYLSYLEAYKKLYLIKYKELDQQESNFRIGVNKINQASEAINKMKIQLGQEQKKLKQATEKTEALLRVLEVQQKDAEQKEAQVKAITNKCQKDARDIAIQKKEAEAELAAALPAQKRAQQAVDSLDAASVNQMKANKKPQQILKITLDAIAIYFNLKLSPIILIPELQISKDITIPFWKNSFEESGKFLLGPNFDFLKNLRTYDKDSINNETIQLLQPLLVEGANWFNETTTGKVSKAIAAICKWLFSVFQYHEKSQIVRPKKIALAQALANLQVAQIQLAKSQQNLRQIKQKVAKLNADSQKQLDNKNRLQQQAIRTKKKINTAQTLINSLSDQKARWAKGASQIAAQKRRLVGNSSLATAFISYCGPFNAEFRQILAVQKFTADMKQKDIPNLPSLAYELTNFLVDDATVGQWNLQGLPKDTLSVQNAIMVTNSDRYPLLIDPQGQGQAWISKKYADQMEKGRSITNLNNPRFKDWYLKFCLQNGNTLIIEGIQNQVDPVLDPVLDKDITWKRSRGSIKVAGQDMDFDKKFKMFLTCRLPNPSFSPQLSAKTTVIDFTVTQGGLEQQLLGRVISHEQKALQDSLNTLLNDVNANKKSLQKLDKDLLQRLTQSKGNLLDDTQLMEVLNNTKIQAKEVAIKIEDAQIKTKQINEKRQQYRPVAIRGSALYFTLIELFLVNWMYNSSLQQFLELFNWSLAQKSPQANSPQKRVDFIIKVMTKHVHRYINRGLFEKDKITFLLMICFKILLTAKKLNGNDVGAFLKAGAGQDIKARPKPTGNMYNFFDEKAWLNILAFSKHPFGQSQGANFKDLPELLLKNNNQQWSTYFQRTDPENYPIPDLAERIGQEKQQMRAFMEMTLIRSVREDRTLVAASKFIAQILGQEYVDPISYPMQDIWSESKPHIPILFLLSPGADPTSAIDQFARKKKKITQKVSMGQGQQQPSRKAIKTHMQSGGWVVLQNCQLGLKFMEQVEQLIISMQVAQTTIKSHQDFRLWITCQPHKQFPLGLLQKVIKVTNEPPKGLKAGLYKTFTTLINQQFLQKVDNSYWKNLIFTICYLHSVVIQRRKYGPLGWCVPYEFNNSDLEASLCFVEKYLNNLANLPPVPGQANQFTTTVLKYMVCEVLYGGRITDDLDRQLFATFGQEYIKDTIITAAQHTFHGDPKDKNAFKYKMPANPSLQISKYHEYIATIPGTDSPQIFGLDLNADLTFRMNQSMQMINTIMETRPKQASGGGGKTRQQIVKDKVQDLLSRMPIDYNESQVKQLIRKLPGPRALGAVGTAVPLNIFLDQEIARMQKVFTIVRTTLYDVRDAIDGQIIMTTEILDSINAIFDARVPYRWVYDATGVQISWVIPTLAKWFNDLTERNKQLNEWLRTNRPYTFWLGGFFNPQGFLTAMKQQVTRMHKGKTTGAQQQLAWSLDDVTYSTTVKQKDQDQIRQGRDKDTEGVFIRQLYLEGARWYKNSLDASKPREIFSPLPLLHVTAINKKKADDKSQYNCPVYKYAKRTDKYLIFRVLLNTETEQPSKWKLKGVTLLCAKE